MILQGVNMIKAITAALLLSLSMTAVAQAPSPEEIAEWRAAAGQGEAWAQSNLGQMYDRGDGVPQDSAVAMKWWTKAAEQGYAKAQYNLALMYADGEGVPKDNATAVKWYTKAAEQGYAEAQYNLGSMYDLSLIHI